ncbi:MAG: NAD(P)/FAD-dependent oxidoreductase [Thiotrichales bacterium]|nr:NAD(P)/FAD-dependent oxidoreductase [Thiotrichales bacterium]
MSENPHRVVIIGGGAGGLELATRLGNSLGRKKRADITLIDRNLTHIWKPLLHEVAAGSLNSHEDEVGYMAHGHWHHFRFRLGTVHRIDRSNKTITTFPALDEHGEEYIPARTFGYDTLVIAVGSETNDFNIPGVKEHCKFLDQRSEADHFHQFFLKKAYEVHAGRTPLREGQLKIAIAGAGATGIELAAELHDSLGQLVEYGFDGIDLSQDIKISIIEAADKILPALPDRLTDKTMTLLGKLGIEILLGERIVEARSDSFVTDSGRIIASEIKVWAAGIRAPDFLTCIEGLETNDINQLIVRPTLQTSNDDDIFAFGDCAACPMPGSDETVPPRAQAAHQQASMLYKSIVKKLENRKLPEYHYVDYGSLINMSRYSTVGNLMGNLAGKFSSNVFIEGVIARFVYLSLYKMHQLALHGPLKLALSTIGNFFTRRMKPRMKLH